MKATFDSEVPVSLAGGKEVRQASPRPLWEVGPMDRAALEAALRVGCEQGAKVVAFSAGGAEAEFALRYALVRGVKSGYWVPMDDAHDPIACAWQAAHATRALGADLVLCGTRSGDMGSGLFAAALAQDLGMPLLTEVIDFHATPERTVTAERRLERGDRDRLKTTLPAVVAMAEGPESRYRYVAEVTLRMVARNRIERREAVEGAAQAVQQATGFEPPRPRAKRGAGPGADLNARGRLDFLLTGGIAHKADDGGFVEGGAEEVANQIVDFLKKRGFVRDSRART